MSYPDVIEAVVLFMKELDNSSKISIRRSILRTQHSDDREKKFAIKTTLYEYFWKEPVAVEEGFNEYLNKKMKYYSDLAKYHEKNCEDFCEVCKVENKNYDYLFEGVYNHERKRPSAHVK
jgi:hypothetical protein